MVAAGLFGVGGDGAEAVLAEPDGCGACAGGYAAYAKELKQGFAAGKSLRLGGNAVRILLRFVGHGDSPG
jgi:hypothetical protein